MLRLAAQREMISRAARRVSTATRGGSGGRTNSYCPGLLSEWNCWSSMPTWSNFWTISSTRSKR